MGQPPQGTYQQPPQIPGNFSFVIGIAIVAIIVIVLLT